MRALTTRLYTLSLHDALPIYANRPQGGSAARAVQGSSTGWHSVGTSDSSSGRSEEHTSELQSRFDLVCRLLLEKKKEMKHDNNLEQLLLDHSLHTKAQERTRS